MPDVTRCARQARSLRRRHRGGALSEIRPVIGFPGYFASDDGEVFSDRSGERRLLATTRDHGGYLQVNVKRNGKATKLTNHRAVLLAFRGEALGRESRHLNGDQLDNRLANLAWGTSRENAADRERHGTSQRGRLGEAANATKLARSACEEIRRRYAAGEPAKAIASEFRITPDWAKRIGIGRARVSA